MVKDLSRTTILKILLDYKLVAHSTAKHRQYEFNVKNVCFKAGESDRTLITISNDAINEDCIFPCDISYYLLIYCRLPQLLYFPAKLI